MSLRAFWASLRQQLALLAVGFSLMGMYSSPQFSTLAYQTEIRRYDWADSVYAALSPRERIGQLFMIRAHSNLDEKHCQSVEQLIREYNVGGLCFFQGGAYRQARLTNRYQQAAKVPLFVAIDGEWGLGMRLDSTMNFPRQMTLGAIQDEALITQMGAEIGRQCQRVGIHINFAPSVDVNNNRDNPVIGDRSFGEDPQNVARKGIAYMQGLMMAGVMPTAKHFPGHGDTNIDSHYGLPIIHHDTARLNRVELLPFKASIAKGLPAAMIAHLRMTAYDSVQTTLSRRVITDLLKDGLRFKGLIFTDAMEMKGLSAFVASGDAEVRALYAGNDVLLLSGDVPKAILMIESALRVGKLDSMEIAQKVKKILRAKHQYQAHRFAAIRTEQLSAELHTPLAYQLQETLYQHALTLASNQAQLLPLRRPDTLRIALVSLGTSAPNKTVAQEHCEYYAPIRSYQYSHQTKAPVLDTALHSLKKYNLVLLNLHNLGKSRANNYGLSATELNFIRQLYRQNRVVMTVFGSPYSLSLFDSIPHVVCAYEDNWITQRLVPQAIFGAIPFLGKLPITASAQYPLHTGITTAPLGRLRYGNAYEVSMHIDTLRLADRIIAQAIQEGVLPGGQLLIARRGKVVYHKAYGRLSYRPGSPNTDRLNTYYDVASLTKVVATLPMVMHLVARNKLDLEAMVEKYLPELRRTPHGRITLRELLTHQAGLVPFIRHWERTLTPDKRPNPVYYAKTKSPQFPHRVGDRLFSMASIEDSLWQWTLQKPLHAKKDSLTQDKFYRYEYSDLSFYFLQRIAERVASERIDAFCKRQFFAPLAMYHTTYQPLESGLARADIAPTEQDDAFRHQLIQGDVHDQGAALLGGLGGHAGLFSCANDLAIYMQMHLQGGYYGGQQYFPKELVAQFAQKQYPRNRRGLGWDKPDTVAISYIPSFASVQSFGHSGFTGCVIWADPAHDLVMVFLSNRIHPSPENDKMVKQHLRRKILDIAYRALTDRQ